MSYIGPSKAKLLQLSTDDLRAAVAELTDYVDRLYQGGGNRNWATQHVGIYRSRLRAVEAELAARQ